MKEAISFIDYNKIQDNLMYFTKTISLKFNVILQRRDKDGNYISNLSEYGYSFSDNDRMNYCIKRNMNFFFTIDDKNNYDNSIMIRTKDIEPLKLLLDGNIIPWFIGNNRIFDTVKNKLVISGKFTKAVFPISESKYMIFYPIILTYDDGKDIEGIRLEMNSPENYIDITLGKFMEFVYYIKNTDMYNAACNALTYVKTPPYLENFTQMGNEYSSTSVYTSNPKKKNKFFDSL